MAYRISATTEKDAALLKEIKDLAWHKRQDVSQIIREAFLGKLYGGQSHWPEEYK